MKNKVMIKTSSIYIDKLNTKYVSKSHKFKNDKLSELTCLPKETFPSKKEFDSINIKDLKFETFFGIISFSSTKMKDFALDSTNGMQKMKKFTSDYFVRIYPKGTNIAS